MAGSKSLTRKLMDKEDNWSLVSAEIRNQKRRRSEGTRESCRTAADRIHHRRRSCKKSSIGSVKPWHWCWDSCGVSFP